MIHTMRSGREVEARNRWGVLDWFLPKGTILSWAGVIWFPAVTTLSTEFLAHMEAVMLHKVRHLDQQGRGLHRIGWTLSYLLSKRFRRHMEAQSIARELLYLGYQFPSWVEWRIVEVKGWLSGAEYRQCCPSPEFAERLIRFYYRRVLTTPWW